MRKVYVAYFKPDTGKYYASEEKEFDETLSIDEIVEKVNELSVGKYKDMFIGITFESDDDIGYPCLILPKHRMKPPSLVFPTDNINN